MTAGWQAFWGGSHRIFVNERHLAAHYRRLGADVATLLADRPGATLLDYGCGDALGAPPLAAAGFDVLLYDPVPAVHARIAQRFAGAARIRVLDDRDWRERPSHSIDAILVHSVLQYLPAAALDELLPPLHRVLRPDGVLYLSDVIPPDIGVLPDIAALLRAGAGNGFLLAALAGLVATFFSDYRKLRRELGLTTWSEAALMDKLQQFRFSAMRLEKNVGFSPHRMLIRAKPRQ
jgi:SAM-dependent methyltransferase